MHVRAFLLALAISASAHAADPLRILYYGPVGEIGQIFQAYEVRIVFSEPMVALGKIPEPVRAPFFRMTPAVRGSFRWADTQTLAFTPEKQLPYATRFDVTIDDSATSLAGNKLGESLKFSFVTPTVRLQSTQWYRKTGMSGDPVVILMTFNQPIDRHAVAAHLTLQLQPHKFDKPKNPKPDEAFNKKVAAVEKTAASTAPVFGFVTDTWNKERYPDSPNLLVFETKPGVPAESWIRVVFDETLPSKEGPETPGVKQEYTIQLERAFFIDGIDCTAKCDPERYNPMRFRAAVNAGDLREALTVTDITDPSKPVVLEPAEERKTREDGEGWGDEASAFSLDEIGYSLEPGHQYSVRVGPSLRSINGQLLGYTWSATIENWHRSAFTSFGDGHGVWEASGGGQLPFYARNFRNIRQWVQPIALEELMPTILKLQEQHGALPPGEGELRKLNVTPDKIQSHGLDISKALEGGQGLVWVGIKEGETIPKAHRAPYSDKKSTIVQVTNLGISVKDSPLNTLIFVTRLDDGAPVARARVAIRNTENKIIWEGTTGSDGIAIAPNTPLRLRARKAQRPDEMTEEEWYDTWNVAFIVTAQKDGDVAYVASNWHEGMLPWEFGYGLDFNEAKPLIRGSLFTDRGVYKLGEEVHFKAILRSDTPTGIRLYPRGTAINILVRNSQAEEVDKRTITLNEWSSAEWTWKVPEEGVLGNYEMIATVADAKNSVMGSFLVAAYRRPEFRVDVTLDGDPPVAGTKLDGEIRGRYLFGAPMGGQNVRWGYSKEVAYDVPAAIRQRFREEEWEFLGSFWDEPRPETGMITSDEGTLNEQGVLSLELDTKIDAGVPYDYTLEGEVEDVSRQTIANRASFRVHPAPWYVGMKELPYFVDVRKGIDTELVAAALDGTTAVGVPITVTLKQIQWHSVRRAEGGGFYTWETERREIDAGKWELTSSSSPVPLHVPLKDGGYYVLTATAADSEGRLTRTRISFYALGEGYTAWERYDHNRIDLVAEKNRYAPGESARIMIKSPWESATALVTTEREGVRTHRQFALTSTQETITVPIRDEDIPNVFVSVLLIKGRTSAAVAEDASDPGKPAFRIGYVKLEVEDASKRLDVDVKANREEFKPAGKAKVTVKVTDANGKAAPSEVTLWAVDYGVLSLTGFRPPDILEAVYVEKGLQVITQDSRQKIVSRRVITPKGADEGGGGGDMDANVRKDFRVLAFWLGSLVTNDKGIASTEVTLPESLTTYRIMAVAADKSSRFGDGESEIRINKPVLLKSAFPRFMALGDKAFFGAVVHSQLKQKGMATVTMKSLDPSVLEILGEKKSVEVPANGAVEVRWEAVAKAIGNARIQMTVRMRRERDAFEEVIPVRLTVTPETVAAHGQTNDEAREAVEVPTNIIPSFGGLHVELASTAMVGLGEGARYLVEYPYGCAEQRASATLALVLATELGDAFDLPGVDAATLRPTAQKNVSELEKFQCGNGGFGYWPGSCDFTSPYLTSYLVHVLQQAVRLGYDVKLSVLDKAYAYLEQEIAAAPPQNAEWMASYTAWQAFTVKVLTQGGRNTDSHLTRLMTYAPRMPVFALSFLHDALLKANQRDRAAEIRRRITNAILPEGGTAHVEELNDSNLEWFWSSDVRSTAIVLGTLVRAGADAKLVGGLVRWLMQVRVDGRWGNTQENAYAMESLIDYYRQHESEVPDFRAVVALGTETLATESFLGRSTEARTRDLPMHRLLSNPPLPAVLRGEGSGVRGNLDLTFRKEGPGTLFYLARLRYASADPVKTALNQGFVVARHYAPMDGESRDSVRTYKAGDLVRVTLTFHLPKERRWVAVTDPVPAGFEPVESWFTTTASDLVEQAEGQFHGGDWMDWWERGGFDHIERHDDRVNLFATRLGAGTHEFSYVIRATTAGTFTAAPAHAEEMYEPEVFGRTATDVVEVKP